MNVLQSRRWSRQRLLSGDVDERVLPAKICRWTSVAGSLTIGGLHIFDEVRSMSSACRVRAITDLSSLEGTAYVEVMAGACTNRCWNDGSLFFEEEVFGYIEPTIEKYEPTYDHYALTQISMLDWEKIIKALADV
ncbi:hypothetical protein [Paraburkholderia sp. BL17N1]|uniref:hypothetical protein n=1 Tax=Paraburkholderia sp. BL17N1 TaxID=1938798 RepID=UPI0011C04C58|nr:hypothetical protein [Paraburkholderia sp. BL17N1]